MLVRSTLPLGSALALGVGDLSGAWALMSGSVGVVFYGFVYLAASYVVRRVPALMGVSSLRREVLRAL